MKGYRDLDAWNHSMRLVEAVYEVVGQLPKEERFGLGTQMRRAAVSIPSNIAEGYGNNSVGRFLDRVRTARGSISELQTQLELVARLDSLQTAVPNELWDNLDRVAKMTHGLEQSLLRRRAKQSR